MNIISRTEQRNLQAVRNRERRLRKKLLHELRIAVEQSYGMPLIPDSSQVAFVRIGRSMS